MGAIFGKKSSPSKINKVSKIDDNDRVVWELKKQRDKIKQYQKRITLQLEKEKDFARKLVQENKKDRALLLLKKKKYMESLLEKSDNNLLNIEQMIGTVEDQQRQLEITDTLKIGNEALKRLNEALEIDKIEDILAETKEGVEKQKEISRLLSNDLENQITESDDELMKELDILMDKITEKEDNKEPDISKLPDVNDLDQVKADKQPSQEKDEQTKSKKVLVEAS